VLRTGVLRVKNNAIGDATTAALLLRIARPDDLQCVEDLLRGNSLPTDGVAEAFMDFLVAERDGALIGAIGLEISGDVALLRSAVVSRGARGQGVGERLVRTIVAHAGEKGVRALFLLTTTAQSYFPRFGFVEIPRSDVPESVRRSPEFRGACPESAVVMMRVLDAAADA
jgi:amino-acid N-acetyltransferase